MSFDFAEVVQDLFFISHLFLCYIGYVMNHKFSMTFVTVTMLIVTVVLIIILFFVNPADINAFGLLGVLAVLYLFFFVLFVFLYRAVELIIQFFRGTSKPKDAIKQQKNRRKIPYIIVALALIPLFLVSFNSLGQLNILNLSLIVLFEILAIFYIVKRV